MRQIRLDHIQRLPVMHPTTNHPPLPPIRVPATPRVVSGIPKPASDPILPFPMIGLARQNMPVHTMSGSEIPQPSQRDPATALGIRRPAFTRQPSNFRSTPNPPYYRLSPRVSPYMRETTAIHVGVRRCARCKSLVDAVNPAKVCLLRFLHIVQHNPHNTSRRLGDWTAPMLQLCVFEHTSDHEDVLVAVLVEPGCWHGHL